MKFSTLMTSILLLFAAQAAQAIQEDQIRGEILSVDADQRVLEVSITEVGDNLDAEAGTTQSYRVPQSVPVEYDIEAAGYGTPGVFDFADIQPGYNVLLDFTNIEDPSAVTRVQYDDTEADANADESADMASNQPTSSGTGSSNDDRRMAANDSGNTRSMLPESASALPMLALIGMVLAGLAFAIRVGRS